MKKLLIAALLLLLLSACAQSEDVAVPKTDVPQTTTKKTDFELVFSSYRLGNTVVYYPRIQGLADAEKQTRLNEQILNDAKKVTTLFGDDIMFITVDYELVEKSDERIVVEYTGHGCAAPDCAAEQTVSYTSSIALE